MLRLFFPCLLLLLVCSSTFWVADTPAAEDTPMWIHVCDDGGAGGYDAFPGICRLQDGRLLCVFHAAHWHIGKPTEQFPLGGRVVACYSADEGKTWTLPQIVIDTPQDDGCSSVVQLADGRILCVVASERFEEDSHKIIEIKNSIVESSDGGKTWSEPRPLFTDYSGPGMVVTFSPIRILSDGTLLMPLYTHDEETSQTNSGAVSLSYDNGKTWSSVIIIPNGGKQLDSETDVVELKDGTLYAIQRARQGNMAISYSKDKGKTWSVSEDAGFPGHCPNFLRTKDDVILLGTRLPATMVRISRDECKTWSAPIKVDDVSGAYPGMVELKDGSILIVYYENDIWESKDRQTRVRIRAKRFHITDTGVAWLPLK